MEYIQEVPALPDTQRSVITLGKFNGVHRGHQKLIRQVGRKGKKNNWKTVVFALSRNVPMLFTKNERREKLEQMGMDLLVDCPLDEHMMCKLPEEFVAEYLVQKLHAVHIVVGPDFQFGYQRKGTVELLAELGKKYDFVVEVLEKERDGEREISSTYIREQLNEGHMEKVNQLLGYPFSTTGEVLHGRGLGHTIGVPTTNLVPPKEKLMPPNGVYVTRSVFKEKEFMGITNVGYKPTVGGERFLGVETYLYDCDEDLYGEQSKVEFYHFLRPEKRFSSLEALKEQLDKDIEEGRKYGD